MRYIQLEKGESIDTRDIVGFFDIESASMSPNTKGIFRRKEEETGVVNVSNDLPKSFLLCDGEFTDTIYISGLSTESIRKRLESEKGMKSFWKK